MCIAICGFNQYPTRKELEQSCQANPDGFGWAFVIQTPDGRKLEMFKTMVAKEAIDSYLSFIKHYGDDIMCHAFHARIATHGAVNLYGCHPFNIQDDSDSVMIHNGILPISIAKTDPRSDSRIFAEDFLPKLGGVHALADQDIFDIAEGFVEGNGSKVVILSTTLEVPLLILGEALGHWHKERPNLWFSNKSYTQSTYGYTYSKPKANEYAMFDSDRAVPCVNKECKSFVSMLEDFCFDCYWCQECDSADANCLCYGATTISKKTTKEQEANLLWEII